ncbi:hypothetical protein BZZ01_08910 [Nostocales cyanobacterium HT-58-2]|nr:hypothetical protein BZZ01_08910 [Nostocales cyanobacterium HT-58-2]
MLSQREIVIKQNLTENSSNYEPKTEGATPYGEIFFVPLFFLLIFLGVLLKQSNLTQTLYPRTILLRFFYRIPCFKCQFFKRNQYLQCAVQPYLVLSKKAINCPDYLCQKDKIST